MCDVIVFIFEFLFQIDGQPDFAAGVLLVGCAATLLVSFVVMKVIARKAEEAHGPEDTEA